MARYEAAIASPDAIMDRLKRTGHYDNPDMPTGVKFGDLPKLTLYSDETRTAIRSFVDMMQSVAEAKAIELHGRRYHNDGEFGPATEATILTERCEHPDYHVPDFDLYDGYDQLDAYDALPAQGRNGNWKGCHDIGDFHAVHVRFLNKPPAHLARNGNLKYCLEAVTKANQAVGLQMYFSGPDCPIQTGEGHAQLTAEYVDRSNGWIGLAQVVSDRPCNSQHWSRYLGTYLRNSTDAQIRRMWPILFLHEFGHNKGTGHTRGGIMNPGILSLDPTWSGDVLSSWLRTHYGGEAIPTKPDEPDPDDPDEPKPPKTGYWFNGTVLMHGDDAIQNYMLVPAPPKKM